MTAWGQRCWGCALLGQEGVGWPGCCWLVAAVVIGRPETLCALSQGVEAALATKPLRYWCGSSDSLSLAGWGWKPVFSEKPFAPSAALSSGSVAGEVLTWEDVSGCVWVPLAALVRGWGPV